MALLLVALAWRPTAAQEPGDSTGAQKRNGLVFIPVLYYSPETKTAFGAALQYYFRESGSADDSRPSNLVPVLIYTQRNQIIAFLAADTYWKDETYRFEGYVGYSKFPDKFYGIGNDTPDDNEEDYTPKYAELRFAAQRRLYSGLYLGLGYQLQDVEITEIDPDGLLAEGNITGSDGGLSSGVSLLANWDTRDNLFLPGKGSFHQLNASFFGRTLGSDFTFSRYTLELRHYLTILPGQTLALQALGSASTGEPPLNQLAKLGGEVLMRGYYDGRYRDKNVVVVQAEYRIIPAWRRLGLVGFLGFGDVADKINAFKLSDFKYSVGGGLRFLLNRAEGITLRLDFGFGRGTSGMYITLGEAF
ncbi:MAG: BamA/TamA family outer membrane protein [Gemmatimonadota bacterium]|nr:MAG: BamA/TamA family outer membrane protein [Gemmatimonadota bacterium]